jgi:heat shock protein HslJ
MHRRQWLWSAVRAVGASAALMGCAQKPPPTPLAGPQWQLVELPGQAMPVAAGTSRPTLNIAGEPARATGTAAVNNFVGTVQMAGGNALTFGPLATTRRAGPAAAMQLEAAYLTALAATRSYRTGAGTLDLLDAQGRTLARFASGSPAAR